MGRAIAEILFGVANPCGRLTTTAPNTLEETPAFLTYPGENHAHLYSESIYVGYRYYDKRRLQPLFPIRLWFELHTVCIRVPPGYPVRSLESPIPSIWISRFGTVDHARERK